MTTEEVKRRLEEERARLERELAALAGEERAGGDQGRMSYATHVADDATDTFDQERAMALEHHTGALLGQVEGALKRIQLGTYGRCERCDQPIGEERLEALPHAALCLNCQSRAEGRR